MQLITTIVIQSLPFNPNANPDTARIRWGAYSKELGASGKGETISEAIAECLRELAEKFSEG